MTKQEIRAILKGLLKEDWIRVNDKGYYLKLLSEGEDLREIINQLWNDESIKEGLEMLQDMDDELSALED